MADTGRKRARWWVSRRWLRETLGHAERQRDDWKRLCNEAEGQREEWRRLCEQAEAQRDHLSAYLVELEGRHGGFRGVELSLAFSGINRCVDSPAQMSTREQVFLYSLVFALAPQRVLEIGTAQGGSASIISAALDDLDLGGRLVTVDPAPEQISIDWSAVEHNTIQVRGRFPRDFEAVHGRPDPPFDLVLVDGDHSYRGVLEDLEYLAQIVAPGAYILLHDAFNAEVSKGIREGVARAGYRDCGIVCRVKNDSLGAEHFAGFHLLLRP